MDQEALLRRAGTYRVTPVGARPPAVLPGRRHAFAEWHVGRRCAHGWRSFTSRTSSDLDRAGRIELLVDGSRVAVADDMVMLYLAPALSAPLAEVETGLLPPVAELVEVWRGLADAGDGTPWVEAYLLETGRPYHARRRQYTAALPPGAGTHDFYLLELADRPFHAAPPLTPRSAGRTG